jgi:choline dehydrogenase-like flavoprotein
MADLSARQRSSVSALARALLPEGHGIPGADSLDVASRLEERMGTWKRRVAASVRMLIRAWDLTPLLSRHLRVFSALSPEDQQAWVASCYRSRVAFRRLHVAALKQMIFLVWASAPEAEDAIGYDYRCRRDDEPHGTTRPIVGEASVQPALPEPADYKRPGPATASGAIPEQLLAKNSFEPRDARLECAAWPDLLPGTERVDVVVIGSGAGGAVAAARLAEAGADVIVLEEGPQVTTEDDFRGPVFDRFQAFCRDNGTTQVWGRPPIPLPLGRVVGGTTVVNSGTCFRAPERVLERWESEFGIEGVAAGGLTDLYTELEDFLNVRAVPWEILGPNGRAAHEGAVALGLSGGPLLRNIADCHGCGQCVFGCPTGAKQAMHITYLPRAHRAGARVYARCRADRIEIEDGRAVAVIASLLHPDTDRPMCRRRIVADHVVVCAGAIHTPPLLNRSKVPDPSGQTSRNLRIHPATGVGGVFEDDSVMWKGTLQSYYIDSLFDSHEVMLEATTTVPGIGAGSIPGIGAEAMGELKNFSNLATLGFYVSDTSKGRVRELPNGDVVPTYRLNELDCHRMYAGLALAAEVLLAAGAKRVFAGLPGLDAVTAREDLDQIRERRPRPEHLRLTAFHPMGTVRMGADPRRAVVDPYGRHHQVANLWVADASTFPTCVGVNPQMTIMAFAARTADRLYKEA